MEKITAALCLLAVMATAAETNVTTQVSAVTVSTENDANAEDLANTSITQGAFSSKENQTFNATTPMSSPDSTETTTTSGTSKNTSTPGPETKKPPIVSTKTSVTVMTKSTTMQTTHSKSHPTQSPSTSSKTYIIILIIIIVCILAVMAFCCVQNKTRKFTLERHSKNEDAQIPLSAVDPEVFEAASLKDMQTFTVVGNSATPADGVEKQDGDKAPPQDNQQEKEGSTDTQATAPLSEKVGELTVVDLNDGEPAISTKTSVESLDEPLNENNSNNCAWASAYGTSGSFTEICLNDLQ